MPQAENEYQCGVSDVWPRILDTVSGNWLQTFINGVLATFIGKEESDIHSAPFQK